MSWAPHERGSVLTGVSRPHTLTPMVKTQVYLPEAELAALHRVAKAKKVPVAQLVREAIREKYLRASTTGPVAIWDGPFAGASSDHDSAFDEP
jgi:hypothetical protein